MFGLVAGSVGDDGGEPDLSALRTAVEAGQVSALYVFDPGPGRLARRHVSGLSTRARSGTLPLLIVQGVLLTDLARAADFVLPGASYVEKEASYTNDQGRLQGTARAIPPPGEAMEDWQILVNLGTALGVPFDYTSAAARPRRHRRALSPASRSSQGLPTLAFDAAGRRAALAAGVEPVGALEVGLHVPGSAAGERRRSIPASLPLPPGVDSAARSEVTQPHRPPRTRGRTSDRASAASVPRRPCVALRRRVWRTRSSRGRKADVTPLVERRRRRRRRARSALALQVVAARRAATSSRTSRAIRL